MTELVCQICGKKIYTGAEWFSKHTYEIEYPTSEEYAKMGGNCGSCGRFCCSECYNDGACPPCHAGLTQSRGPLK